MKATPLLALAAPFVIFGFLYALVVQPARTATPAARDRASSLRAELMRGRALIRATVPAGSGVPVGPAVAVALANPSDVTAAITSLAKSPAVGGVTNLSVEMAAPDGTAQTPVTVMFDAPYAQIGRFFWNLRTLPAIFEVRSVEIEPARSPSTSMRAKIVLVGFKRATAAPPAVTAPPVLQTVDMSTAPGWRRNPFPVRASEPGSARQIVLAEKPAERPDPVVKSILFSASRQVALVDGRVVKTGDRVGPLFVQSIEPDGVVLATADGLRKRIGLDRPTIRIGRQ